MYVYLFAEPGQFAVFYADFEIYQILIRCCACVEHSGTNTNQENKNMLSQSQERSLLKRLHTSVLIMSSAGDSTSA